MIHRLRAAFWRAHDSGPAASPPPAPAVRGWLWRRGALSRACGATPPICLSKHSTHPPFPPRFCLARACHRPTHPTSRARLTAAASTPSTTQLSPLPCSPPSACSLLFFCSIFSVRRCVSLCSRFAVHRSWQDCCLPSLVIARQDAPFAPHALGDERLFSQPYRLPRRLHVPACECRNLSLP